MHSLIALLALVLLVPPLHHDATTGLPAGPGLPTITDRVASFRAATGDATVRLPPWIPERAFAVDRAWTAPEPGATARLEPLALGRAAGGFAPPAIDPPPPALARAPAPVALAGLLAGAREAAVDPLVAAALQPPSPPVPADENGYHGFFDLRQALASPVVPAGVGFWNASGMQHRLGSSVRELRCCGDEPRLVLAFGLGCTF